MSEAALIDRIVRSREAAHVAANDAYRAAQCSLDDGKPVHFLIAEYERDRSLQANRFYWGACLREISDQARIGGQQYTVDAWHELFRRQFLGYEIENVHVAGRKKAVINRRLKSTRKLKVKAFATYLEQVQAFACQELSVQFSCPSWDEYEG